MSQSHSLCRRLIDPTESEALIRPCSLFNDLIHGELYSCKCMSNDQWWSCLSPSLRARSIANHHQRPASRPFAWSTPPLAWKTSSHSNWGIRDLQEGLGWCGARIWGSHWSSMTGVEPICWGVAQTHSTANANIRYRPQNILTAPSGDIWQSPYLGCIPTFKRRLSSSSPSIFSQRLWNLDGQA